MRVARLNPTADPLEEETPPEQIIKLLKAVESGSRLGEVCREHNISEQTYYRWKRKYGGMEPNEARRMKDLEEENLRLKRLVGSAHWKSGGARWTSLARRGTGAARRKNRRRRSRV